MYIKMFLRSTNEKATRYCHLLDMGFKSRQTTKWHTHTQYHNKSSNKCDKSETRNYNGSATINKFNENGSKSFRGGGFELLSQNDKINLILSHEIHI